MHARTAPGSVTVRDGCDGVGWVRWCGMGAMACATHRARGTHWAGRGRVWGCARSWVGSTVGAGVPGSHRHTVEGRAHVVHRPPIAHRTHQQAGGSVLPLDPGTPARVAGVPPGRAGCRCCHRDQGGGCLGPYAVRLTPVAVVPRSGCTAVVRHVRCYRLSRRTPRRPDASVPQSQPTTMLHDCSGRTGVTRSHPPCAPHPKAPLPRRRGVSSPTATSDRCAEVCLHGVCGCPVTRLRGWVSPSRVSQSRVSLSRVSPSDRAPGEVSCVVGSVPAVTTARARAYRSAVGGSRLVPLSPRAVSSPEGAPMIGPGPRLAPTAGR